MFMPIRITLSIRRVTLELKVIIYIKAYRIEADGGL